MCSDLTPCPWVYQHLSLQWNEGPLCKHRHPRKKTIPDTVWGWSHWSAIGEPWCSWLRSFFNSFKNFKGKEYCIETNAKHADEMLMTVLSLYDHAPWLLNYWAPCASPHSDIVSRIHVALGVGPWICYVEQSVQSTRCACWKRGRGVTVSWGSWHYASNWSYPFVTWPRGYPLGQMVSAHYVVPRSLQVV